MSDGTIEESRGHVTFSYQRYLQHPVDVVWRVLTQPARNESWFGGRIEIDLRPDGNFISYHQGGVRVVDRVVRVQPPTLLEHTFWVDVNPSALVTWQLSPENNGCTLGLTHSLSMDDVRAAASSVAAGDDLRFILSRNAAGWHRLLDKLEAALDGRDLAWSEGEQKSLQERYAAMLG